MPAIVAPTEWRELIAQQRWEELQQKLEDAHFSDIAEIIACYRRKTAPLFFG